MQQKASCNHIEPRQMIQKDLLTHFMLNAFKFFCQVIERKEGDIWVIRTNPVYYDCISCHFFLSSLGAINLMKCSKHHHVTISF